MTRWLLALLCCCFVVAPATAQPSLTLNDVRTAYRSLDGLRADFTQVVATAFSQDSSRLTGTVTLSGDRYRVETPGQVVVTNGSSTWIYTPADSQVVIDEAAANNGPITPETFLNESAGAYDVTDRTVQERGGGSHVVLSLASTDSTSRFQAATLWVRASDRVVTRLRATDRDGATFDLRLRNLEVNPALSEETFTFSAPENVEVVDLRSGD